MAKHSKLGGSQAERWMNCPGSVSLIETLPERGGSSVYAAEGTAAHQIAEEWLKKGIDYDGSWEGEVLEIDEHRVKVTEEMLEAVSEYCPTIYQDMEDEGVTREFLNLETELQLKHIDPECYGRLDAELEIPFKCLYLYDYKHGAGVPVEVGGNKQLLYYAVGRYLDYDVDKIILTIVQPRCPHSDGPVRRWEVSRQTVKEFEAELKASIAETRKTNAPCVPGKHCHKTFCPALSVCKAVGELAEETAKRDFQNATLPTPSDLAADQISLVLKKADILEAWIKAVREHAHQTLERGGTVTGFKLIQRKGNRRWKNEREVIKKYNHLGSKIFKEPKLISPAQMEKIVDKKELVPFTERPMNGTSMVPEEHKAPALPGSAVSDFTKIEKRTCQNCTQYGGWASKVNGELGRCLRPPTPSLKGYHVVNINEPCAAYQEYQKPLKLNSGETSNAN